MKTLPKGSTLGILGSGQLGRMTCEAAHQQGYKVHTYSPDSDSPTGQLAEKEWVADYSDEKKLAEFARSVDAITFEFENVPSGTAATLAKVRPLFPNARTLHICQNRIREKTFLSQLEIPVAPFQVLRSEGDFALVPANFPFPAVLKTADSGYDGKGQIKISRREDLLAAFTLLKRKECILEAFIDFESEASVIGARAQDGTFSHWGLITNEHRNHILDVATVPPRFSHGAEPKAVEITQRILQSLEVMGLLCVEFFITREGDLLVNEMAPRPHNSGHWTIEASETSQFAQLVRIVTGQPLGTASVRPAAMANLLGDLWEKDGAKGEPDWKRLELFPSVSLHLYGKREARPGRKMGHLTAVAATAAEATELVLAAREALA